MPRCAKRKRWVQWSGFSSAAQPISWDTMERAYQQLRDPEPSSYSSRGVPSSVTYSTHYRPGSDVFYFRTSTGQVSTLAAEPIDE